MWCLTLQLRHVPFLLHSIARWHSHKQLKQSFFEATILFRYLMFVTFLQPFASWDVSSNDMQWFFIHCFWLVCGVLFCRGWRLTCSFVDTNGFLYHHFLRFFTNLWKFHPCQLSSSITSSAPGSLLMRWRTILIICYSFPSFPKLVRESLTFQNICKLLPNSFEMHLVAAWIVVHMSKFH